MYKLIDGTLLKKLFIGALENLYKNKEIVNSLNVFPVPDGDTGNNMYLTLRSAVDEMNRLKGDLSIKKISTALSNGSLMGARGNSGVILSQLFRGFDKVVKDYDEIDCRLFARALKEGVTMAYKAIMKPVEGTILTVARECAEEAIRISVKDCDLEELLKGVIKKGEEILNKTPDMLPILKQANVVDAGGKGLIFIYEGMLKAIRTREEDICDFVEKEKDTKKIEFESFEEIKFQYCTEFILRSDKVDSNKLKNELVEYGDSLLVIGDFSMIKVHIHTNHPGLVLEKAIAFGELSNIKIENMKEQHSDYLNLVSKKENKKYAIITVCTGDGLKNLFSDLGVDEIVDGGQTMNPSTQDFIDAIDRMNAENIFILPNNKNIILSAMQAKEYIKDKNIIVIPTTTIPQGISALLEFNPSEEVMKNQEKMNEGMKKVKTGLVTFSIRDTLINGKEIKKDDILGIKENEIAIVGKEPNSVAMDLIRNMVDEDDNIITVYYGQNIPDETANDLKEGLISQFKDREIQFISGQQPIYYYIISVEK